MTWSRYNKKSVKRRGIVGRERFSIEGRKSINAKEWRIESRNNLVTP